MTYVNYLNCNKGNRGTGTIECEIPTGVPVGFIPVPKGWTHDPTTETFDDDYITEQIKKRNFIPFLDSIGFTPDNEERGIFTTQTKIKIKSINGKPGFIFDYANGYHFHKAAFSHNSYNRYDFILVYDNGVLFLAETNDGKLKGHKGGIMDTDNYMHANGTDSEKTSVMIQLTNPDEYNLSGVLLDPAANSFDMDNHRGIVDATVEKVSNNTADVVVKVNVAANSAIAVKGLDETNFRALGTSETIVSQSRSITSII